MNTQIIFTFHARDKIWGGVYFCSALSNLPTRPILRAIPPPIATSGIHSARIPVLISRGNNHISANVFRGIPIPTPRIAKASARELYRYFFFLHACLNICTFDVESAAKERKFLQQICGVHKYNITTRENAYARTPLEWRIFGGTLQTKKKHIHHRHT